MTFTTTIVNNLGAPVTVLPSNTVISDGSSGSVSEDFILLVSGFGSCVVQDIGNNHIPGDDPGLTWGVLIVYQGLTFVGRYEGGGAMTFNINCYGQIYLQGMFFDQVELPGLLSD